MAYWAFAAGIGENKGKFKAVKVLLNLSCFLAAGFRMQCNYKEIFTILPLVVQPVTKLGHDVPSKTTLWQISFYNIKVWSRSFGKRFGSKGLPAIL